MEPTIILLLFCGLLIFLTIALCTWGLIRNQMAYRFLNKILNTIERTSHDVDTLHRKIKVYKKVSYVDVAGAPNHLAPLFRPMRMETYWSKEDIKILTT